MSALLKHITAAAKGLSKAELHVLIELASRAEEAGANDAVASSRELAEKTGLARASVQAAIDKLNRSGLINSDAGAATRSAMHRLLFLDAVEIRAGGPTSRPGVAQNLGQGGLNSEPAVAQKLGQGGPSVRPVVAEILSQGGLDSGPLPNEKSVTRKPPHIENASAPAESIENDFDKLIDRLQKSKKSDFHDEIFEQARNLIASHHAKFARDGFQMPGLPDDQITAQFLAVADWPRLSRMLYDLMSERKQPSFSWGWYVTVALQRIYGIPPEQVRKLRTNRQSSHRLLAMARQTSRSEVSSNGDLSCSTTRQPQACSIASAHMTNFDQQIQAIAARKSLR